ncbi:MAG: hypothetical protein KF784_09585 [Fimbriimonadaceae bacterium]|nr:hypothetical protein [Fimbriimonadaceae bacterium]
MRTIRRSLSENASRPMYLPHLVTPILIVVLGATLFLVLLHSKAGHSGAFDEGSGIPLRPFLNGTLCFTIILWWTLYFLFSRVKFGFVWAFLVSTMVSSVVWSTAFWGSIRWGWAADNAIFAAIVFCLSVQVVFVIFYARAGLVKRR